jgi:hypothetical protein
MINWFHLKQARRAQAAFVLGGQRIRFPKKIKRRAKSPRLEFSAVYVFCRNSALARRLQF